jgi:hypothetical protein
MDISSPTRELLAFLGGLALAIPSYVSIYRNWKKSRIEDAEAEARTELARKTTESIQIRESLATGEGVGNMLTSLIEVGEQFGKVQERMFQAELDKIELKMARQDIRQLKGLLDAHGISYSEKDHARTKDS